MIKRYTQQVKASRTVNALNQVHIELGNTMTPLELAALEKAMRTPEGIVGSLRRLFSRSTDHTQGQFDPDMHARQWLAQLSGLMALSGKQAPEPFERRALHSHIHLYTDAHLPADKKTLVICFTGKKRRMMAHTPVFLQHFNAGTCDVLLVSYPKEKRRMGYYEGIPGIGERLESMIANLQMVLPFDTYRRTAVMGVSAGALPAMMTALRHGAAAALMVGIVAPTDQRAAAVLGSEAGFHLGRMYAAARRRPSMTLLHGDHAVHDAAAAAAWKAQIPEIALRDVSDSSPVRHNPIMPLIHQGRLAALVSELLLVSAE